MGKSYTIKDLLDKPLIAKKATKLYRLPYDSAKHYASVAAGQPLGTLYSWINPNANTKYVWFSFYDSKNKPYYVPYKPNLLNSDDLKRQGVKDVETQTKEKKEQEKLESKGTFRFYLEKYAPYIIGALFIVPIAKKIIDKKI